MLEKKYIAVGEMPNIYGKFGVAVPQNHNDFRMGVFSATNFGTKKSKIAQGDIEAMVYGYILNFGNDKYHENISPALAAYGWKRIS